MKKRLIFGLALTLLTLSACGKKEVIVEECDPIIKETVKNVEKEVIKEVKVPTEVIVNKDYSAETERLYTPGTYFRSLEANKDGEVKYAIVSIDNYGRIAGVHISYTTEVSKYKYDEETNELFVRVDGLEDVIPNSYRLVTPGVTKSLEDAFTPSDLIEGYPLHDARIAKLVSLNANETQAIVDYNSAKFSGSYTDQMEKLAKKIILDQGTYGINLYKSGKENLTTNVEGVTIDCLEEINLVQSILDTDAKYTSETIIIPVKEAPKGLYKAGTYYNDTIGLVSEGNVFFNTSLVVVDEFGNLTTVFLDETANNTTKKLSDADWSNEVSKVETAIINNKSCNGFKYLDESGKETTYNNNLKDNNYSDLITLSNVKDVTMKVNGLLSPVIDTLTNTNEAKLALVPGNYYMADEDGNMMSVSIRNVVTGYERVVNKNYNEILENDANADDTVDSKSLEAGNFTKANVKKAFPIGMVLKSEDKGFIDNITPDHIDSNKYAYRPTYEAQIVAMSLDTVYSKDQATFEFEGVKYPLYTYDKSYELLSLEQDIRPTFIFKNNDEYFYAEDFTLDGEEYEVEDKVKFNETEEATVKAVVANLTKQTLKDELGMKTRDDQLEWYEQANAYTNAFIGKNSAYIFNMISPKKTDSISGVTIDIDKYNNLLVLLLASAEDERNINFNVVDFNSQLGLSEFKAGKSALESNEYKNASFTNGYKLANGTYYSYSKLPNSDGEYALVTFTVYNNQLVNVMLDETTVNGSALNTKVNLGEDYRVNTKMEKSDSDKELTYAKRIKDVTNQINVGKSLSDLVDGYDYELETTLAEDKDFFTDKDAYSYKFNDAMERGLLEALRNRVSETMKGVNDTISDSLEEKYVVASDENDGALTIDLSDSINIATVTNASSTTKFDVEVELEEQDKVLDLDDTNNVWTLNADVDDVLTTTTTKFNTTVEFDDYDVVTKESEVKLMSNHDYKKEVLASTNDSLNLAYNTMKDGQMLNLSLVGGKKGLLDTTRLGNGNDINPNVNFKFQELDNVMLSDNLLGVSVKFDGKDFYLVDTLLNTDNIDGYTVSLVKGSTSGKFIKLSEFDTITLTNASGALSKEESLEKLHLALLKALLAKDNEDIKVNVVDDKKNGKVTVRAFFDTYEQDEEYLGIWQRGEVSKDFSFDVLTAENVNKLAKANIKIKGVDSYITSDIKPYMLTTASDLEVSGVNEVKYSAEVDYKTVEKAMILKDANGKEYTVFNAGSKLVIPGSKDKFTEVTLVNGVITLKDADKVTSGITEIGGVTGLTTSEAYDIATDGFHFLTDSKGTINAINVSVSNLSSNRLTLNVDLDGSELKEIEVMITRANNKELVKRAENELKNALDSKFNLKTFSDLALVVSSDVNEFDIKLFDTLTLSNADKFDISNIELKWFDAKGKEITWDGEAPKIGDVLLNQVSKPENGKDVESSIKVVITYEMDDSDLTFETSVKTVIYNNEM